MQRHRFDVARLTFDALILNNHEFFLPTRIAKRVRVDMERAPASACALPLQLARCVNLARVIVRHSTLTRNHLVTPTERRTIEHDDLIVGAVNVKDFRETCELRAELESCEIKKY